MNKKLLYKKETYAFQFTEEDRKKINDFLEEFTGLKNITEINIQSYGMYIETLEEKEN